MPDQKLVEYIKSQLSLGADNNSIRNSLMANGSLPSEIDLAFNSLNTVTPPPVHPVIPPYPPVNSASTSVSNELPTKSPIYKKVLISVVAVLLVAGVSVGAYFGYNYLKGTPITLGGAVVNTLEAFSAGKITSGEFSLTAGVTIKDVGKNYSDLAPEAKQVTSQLSDVAINLVYSGIVNKTAGGKYETSGDLSASIKNPTGGSLGMFGPQEAALKYKTFSDNIYLNIQKIPTITAFVVPPSVDLTKYLNQWFSMPSNFAEQTSSAFMDGFTANGTRNMSTTSLAVTDEIKGEIVSFLDESGAFQITERKPEKTEKGTAVTALYLKIDWDKAGDAIVKLNKEKGGKNGIAPFTKADELQVRASIEKAKELPINNSVIKILVGSDGYIHGYAFTGDLMDQVNKQNKIGNYNVSFVADNLNKTFVIDRPTDARDFNSVMAEIDSLMNAKNTNSQIRAKK